MSGWAGSKTRVPDAPQAPYDADTVNDVFAAHLELFAARADHALGFARGAGHEGGNAFTGMAGIRIWPLAWRRRATI